MTKDKEKIIIPDFIRIGEYLIRVECIDALIQENNVCSIYGRFEGDRFYKNSYIRISDEIKNAFAKDFIQISNNEFIRISSIVAIRHGHNTKFCDIMYNGGSEINTKKDVSKKFVSEAILKNFNIKI